MANRIGDDENLSPDVWIITALHRAGWSVGDTATRGEDGQLVWLVTSANGENVIRAEGASSVVAWESAVS